MKKMVLELKEIEKSNNTLEKKWRKKSKPLTKFF